MKILVAGIPSSPFEAKYQIHYSVHKIFGTATGFSDLGHEVYLMSRKEEKTLDGVKLKPYNQMDKKFVSDLDLIIFTIEGGVEKCIDASDGLKWLEKEKLSGKSKNLPKIICKMGKHNWLKNTRWGLNNSIKLFDHFFVQEIGFLQDFKRDVGLNNLKINVSNMGVPKVIPSKEKCPFKKSKYNLFYMGRMRQTPSKMKFMVDMMNYLGSNYKLVILPGTFSKPGLSGRNKFGPQTPENFRWLNNFFSRAPNIDLHYPVNWGEHWNYLHNSDVGIDFAPHFKVDKYPAGNAKLLEYMTAGLPSITEVNTGNSDLILQANGGLLVQKSCPIDEYSKAIKKILSMKFDRKKISQITIKNNNWEVRARQMLKDMEI